MERLEDDDPRRLGNYTLTARLGEGGMGVVYLAETPRGTPVAVKTLSTGLRDQEGVARFHREVAATLRVASPFTARVLHADVEHAPPYLVTELVDGETVRQRIDRRGSLWGPEAVALAAGVAEALAAMHRVGVVHRDLSPGNVIVGVEGPKVVDLGVAAIEHATRLTQTGLTIGTPAFMSPEQVRGEEVGPAADVFSWGSLVTFASTGKAPFGEGRPEVVLYRIAHESADLAGIEEPLGSAIIEALAKEPSQRPHAHQLVSRLVGIDPGAESNRRTQAVSTLVAAAGLRSGDNRDAADMPAGVVACDTPSRRRYGAVSWVAVVLALAAVAAGATYATLQLVQGAQDPETGALRPASRADDREDLEVELPSPDERESSLSPPPPTQSDDPPAPDHDSPEQPSMADEGVSVPPDIYETGAPHPLKQEVSQSWTANIHRELSAAVGQTITASVCGSVKVPLEFSDRPPSLFVCIAYEGDQPLTVFEAGVSSASSEWGRSGELGAASRPHDEVLDCWTNSAPWLPAVVADSTGETLYGPAANTQADIQALGSTTVDYNVAIEGGLSAGRAARYAYGMLLARCATGRSPTA